MVEWKQDVDKQREPAHCTTFERKQLRLALSVPSGGRRELVDERSQRASIVQ